MAIMSVKMKVEVPKWAKYLAQDSSGRWYFYKKKPYTSVDSWLPRDGFMDLAYTGPRPLNFTLELYELY